jgi:large repetitive protein
MKGTFTFTDGASNQTNLTKTSNSEAKGSIFPFAQDLFRKVKQLFVQKEIIEPIVETVFIEQSVNHNLPQTISNRNVVIEEAIPDVVIKRESHSSQLNYQLNIQQMNLFTYLKRAITSSEESLSGQFLEQFKTFLSVIVGAASDNNAPLGSAKRDFGILSNLGGSKLLSNKIFNQPAMRSWASVMFLTLFTAFGTIAQTGSTTPQPDVSVKKTISTQSPTLNQDVTYTIKVRNDGTLKATGVELTDVLPEGVTFKSVSVGGIGSTTNSTTAGVTTIVWNIGEVPATATDLTMTIVATVIKRGLFFNTAEITKEVEIDLDSTPNNHVVGEDDQDAVCFSIEEYFYKGDEFTTALPAGYTNIQWTKKVGTGAAVAVTATTPGVVLLTDGSGNIKITDITAYTEFAFTASNKNCPISGCCPIKFIPGPLGSIGDFVFTDTNKDGIQTLGEPGLAGIKVQLYKADGVTLVDEVTTDVNGKYLFDSLLTGSYKVKFILPSGSTFTDTGKGTTATDSDAGLNGFSGVINIDVEKTGIDKDNPTIDAGIIGNLGSIGDFVFRDDNSNGIQDATEPGIAGVTVNLYKGAVLLATTTTDASGKYNFGGLSSGTDYQVEFVAPAQSKFTTPSLGGDPTKDSDAAANGKSGLITIDVTKPTTDILRNNPTIDAGIIPLGSIGDYVFNDNNGNGIQDAGDTKLPGIKVTLTDMNGVVLTSTTTDADGKYEFIVPSGMYFVIFDKPTGSTFSPTGAGTPVTDSDADATGKSSKITIDASKPVGDPARNNTTVDAGLIPNKGTIGDFVFVDANGNNKQDVGEAGLAGVTVELYDATGTTKLDTKLTDANGKYLFTGLESGGYKVKFILPSGKTFVTPNVGTFAEDSDAGTGGFSGVINIDVTKPLGDIGRNNLTIDAGVKADCNINAGTLATTTPNFCLPDAGSVVLTATVATAPTVPTGYSVKYVLTKGTDLVIQQVSNAPTFTVTTTGEYRIHTLVYDGNSANGSYLDLSTIILGTTKASDVLSSISQKSLCAALDATGVKFNVNPIPSAPVFAGKTICAGETAKIGLDGPIILGVSYAWFTSATATTPFATTQSIDVTPTVTTTYYVETTLVTPNACTSKRGSVTVTVNPKPENPVAKSTLGNDCTRNLQTVNLADAITTTPAGSTIEWHVANDPTSAIITNTTTAGAGTYYAFAKSTVGGCYSGGVSVTVTITPCNCQNPATVSVSPIAAVCGNTSAIIQLGATIGGGATSGTWTSNGTGTYDNATSLTAKYTPSVADVVKGSVEFTFTTNDPDGADTKCLAASAKTTLTFKAKPAAPTSLRCEPVICLGDSNKLFSVSQGNVVKWYATATSTTSLGTATDAGFVVAPSPEGTYTYYAEATTPEGCVSERSSISFIVKKCLTDLAVIKKVYTPDVITTPDYLLGQTATYSIEAQNIGDANATDVKVADLLPAGATYVSSTPTGEYNSTTGIWTIGSLTKGSNKSLLIQVTLGQKGTVVNTATISGTNEDPTKLANNTSTVTIKVVDIADLSLTKTVNKSVVNTGDEIEYTITVLNSGPNTATNVEVKDKLPVGLTYVSSSTLTESAGVLTGTAASIAKGATAVFTFKAKVAMAGKITNLAEVSKSDQKDPDSTPGNASTKADEDDDDAVDINSTFICNIDKPTIACGCTQKTICLGGETTLTATGCLGSSFVWSNGGTTSSITVSPKTNQTYTVYCQKDNCKSESSNAVEVKVIVVDSPLLSASPSKICAGESTTLTASGCGGVIEWQTSPKQTGPSITVTPTVSETYKAVCKEFDCVSALASVDVIVTPTPKAPVIVCEKGEICPGETITMTAMNCNGQVKWSTGQETTTITVFPTVTTSYTVTCSVNGCTSDPSKPFVLTVKPVIVPTIKTTDLIVCTGGSATLTAEGCTGKVTWYYDGKTSTGATIVVKPIATTAYYATCSTISCTSDKSSTVTVQVVNPSPPIVSSGTSTICSGSSVELTATGCEGGIVTWSDGQKGAVVTVKPLVSTSYTATCSIGTCVSATSLKRNITVTDFAKPTITADKLAICVGNTVTLTANGCNGTVKWSDGVTGSPRTVTPTTDVKYTATCESATCKSDVSNELAIKVNVAGPAPVISCLKTEICAGESVTLTAAGCTGTVKWSDGSTGTTVTVRPTTSTTYSAICSTNTCDSPKSNEKTITVNPAVVLNLTASASSPRICAGVETTLTLAGCTGTITWTGGLTGVSIKVKPTETTTYTATCSGVACATDASATVKVTVLPGATTPNITPTNTQICAGAEVTLTANNCNGALLWSSGQTTSSITVKPTVTTIYSVKCTVDGCGEAKTSEPVTVKVGTPDAPTVTSVPPSVCAGGTVVLTAVGCTAGTVVWSNGKTGATLTETVNATTVYSAVCKQGTCNSPESNKVTVTVTIPSVPTISCATSTICAGSTITLVATGCEGTVKWSDGQTGAIVTSTPTKTTDYTATCTIGTCTSSPSSVATVNVGNPPAPSITCSATSICQGVQVTLTATNCTGTIVWNDGQVGNVITAKPNATTTYTAICKLDKCESGKSNAVTVTVGAGIKTPTTKNLNNVCPFLTVDLASGVTSTLSAGGTFEYHTGVLPTSPLVSNPNAVGTGTYYVFEKTGGGCYSAPGVINTYINTDCTPKDCAKTPATVSAGADATICAEKIYKLSGTYGGAATSIVWKTTGSGSFDNPLSPTATYRSSLADVLAGTIKLIICTNDPDGSGPCKATADTMTLIMNGVKFKPTVAVTGNLNSCGTDSVTLTATAGYAYMWFKVGTSTAIATTRSIVVKSSGGYFFKLVDPNKCCSIESDTATVNYLVAPNAPVANSVKIDRGTTVDLNKLVVSNLPTGATLIFKTGASSASTTVANPSAVGAGTYYACYRNAQGCYSLSTKITVENKDGTLPSTDSDIQITVTTENNIALDSTVKVTITVKNNGPATGKNVVVSAPIPTGLIYVSSTGGLVKSGTLLNGTLDSLISGGVKVYTWVGKISGTTTTITVGATATTTSNDPNPNNNNGSNPNGNVVVSVPPANSSDIVVTITTDKTTYAVGDTVTTTIKVTNLGPATAKNVTVSSTIPDKLTYVSQTGGLVVNGKVLTGKLDSLVKNGMKIYIFKSVLTGTGPVVITGTGTSNNPDPNPNNNNGTGTNGSVTINPVVVQGADVLITITTDKTTYAIGDIVTTTIKVTNLGPQTAKGINVSSTLPSILEYIAQTGGLTKTGNVFTASIDSLVKDGMKVYTYTAKVTGNGTATITATGTSTTTDPNPSNNNGTGTGGSVTITGGSIIQPSGADVVITITTNKSTYAVGDTVTTTIKVTNLGPDVAKGINIFSVIPGTLTYIGQTGGLVKVGNLLTATIASLDKDGTVTYTYKSVLNTKSETVLAAGGTSTTKDPNPNNNNGTGTTGTATINKGDVDPTVADVAIVITADKTKAKVGEDVNFILTLTNNGPATAKQVVLVNPIPAGLTFVSSSTGQVLTSGAISVSLDSLQKGQVRTYLYVAKMNVKTDVTNTVSVGSFKDNVGPNNFSFVTINGDTTGTSTGKDEAELALLLTADKQLIAKDDVVTFTIKVTNNGPKVATNVVVDNILPKYLTFQSGDPSQKGDTLRVATASIPVGGMVTYTYKAKVNKDTIIRNTAKITKTSPTDPILTNNVSTVVLVPASDTTYADLAVTIAANKSTYKEGDNVTYTVTLTNNGAGFAKNVQLCNPIPSGLTYVSGTGVIKAGDSVTVKVDTISKGKTRTFTYVVKATKEGTIANTVRICNSSKADLITPNNTSTSSITVTKKDSVIVLPTCSINLAMAILDTAKVSTGVYDVTYRLIAKNVCKDTLKNVTLYNDLAKTFKTPVTCEIKTKPTVDANTNLVANDLFSKTDSSMVKTGGYMLPNAIDTIRYVVRVTLNGNKGPFVSNATIAGKTTGNENLIAKAKETLRFDLPNTRIGLAKEVVTTALKNDSTTYWTVPYRIRVVNMGANAITKLSVKDSLDAVFTAKGAVIIGTPIVIGTPGLTVNKKYTGKGLFTDLLVPDSSSLAKGDTAIIDLTVRVNVAAAPDAEKIFNNVAIGNATGTDKLTYKDISTNGNNPDKNGDKDPSNDNEATPVQLKRVGPLPQLQVSIGLALAAVRDTIPLADSTCNVTLIMTAKNYGKDALRNVRLCTNIQNTIGKQSESWKLVGKPVVIKGNAKISGTFNGIADSTITKSDSSFLAVGDSIVIAYMVNIKKPTKDTIYTQAIAKARSAVDTLKLTSDISMNGLKPDINGDGSPDEAAPTPIICNPKPVVIDSLLTVLIPNAFSPNGDGIHDGFVIGGIKSTEMGELIIFNRWGGVVYTSKDYKSTGADKDLAWKGESNAGVVAVGKGQGLPDGTYFYCFTLYQRLANDVRGEKIGNEQIKSLTLLR